MRQGMQWHLHESMQDQAFHLEKKEQGKATIDFVCGTYIALAH
jgi:hypothetical protein